MKRIILLAGLAAIGSTLCKKGNTPMELKTTSVTKINSLATASSWGTIE